MARRGFAPSELSELELWLFDSSSFLSNESTTDADSLLESIV